MGTDTYEYPPGPSQKLPESLLIKFMRDPITTLMNIARNYGNISHFKFGRQPQQPHIYLLNHPDYIKEVLMNDGKSFIKSSRLQADKQIFGEGLLYSEGDFHHRRRRLMQPAFHRNNVIKYGPIIVDHGIRVCQQWENGTIVDIHKELMVRLTLPIVIKILFGIDDKTKDNEFSEAVTTVLEYFNRVTMPFGEFFEKLSLGSNRRFEQAKSKLDIIIYRIINERRLQERSNSDRDREDLLSILLQAQDTELEDGSSGTMAGGSDNTVSKMTDLQLRDEIMTLFLAAHEPMANALTWTFYLISQHPDVEERLHTELDTVFENGRRQPTVQDISKLQYTEMLFTECLRLYPPAWTMVRHVLNDYPIDKYIIPARSVIILSQYVTHHDERFFHEPDRFDPERWTQERKIKIPRFSYFPFGGGSRTCIGEPFAWMEGILLIATIARQWKMQLEPGHRVALQPLVTLRPKYGMPMKLGLRKNNL